MPNGQEVVEKVTDAVKEGGGNFITRLLMAPINVISGLGKGLWDNTIGNLSGTLLTSGIIAGITTFAPSLLAWLPFKVNGKKVGETLGEDMRNGGTGAMLKDSLLAGAAIQAVIGMGKGALNGVSGGVEGEESSFLGKTAGFVGGGLALVAIGALVKNSMDKHGVGYAGNFDEATSKQPNIPPAATNNQEVSGKNA